MDPYRVLGISTDATMEEIKKRFRELARLHHPDKNASNSHEAFVEIRNAYDRVVEDRERETKSEKFPSYQSFQPRTRTVKPTPCIVEVPLTESDVYYGATKHVDFEIKTACERCEGSGNTSTTSRICPGCTGTGYFAYGAPCFMCGGWGKINIPVPCQGCSGGGSTYSKRSYDIRCPKGVPNRFRHIMRAKGAYDNNAKMCADLIFVFTYDNFSDRIKVNGKDVHVEMGVDLSEVLSGFKRVLVLYNEKYIVKSEGYADPSKEHRIPGEGLPGAKEDETPGDLVIRLQVKYPEVWENQPTSTLSLASKTPQVASARTAASETNTVL